MQKRFMLGIWLAGCSMLLSGVEQSLIMTKDGRKIPCSTIRLLPKGELEYVSKDNTAPQRIDRISYRYARIPKPAKVTEADHQYKEHRWKEAAQLYHAAAAEYQVLGWYAYCIRMEAESLIRTGNKESAIRLLQIRKQEADPEHEMQLANDRMADLLIDGKKYDEARKRLDTQFQSEDPELVFAAYFKSALILQATGHPMEAARVFYQAVLLFPKAEKRAEALYNVWSILTEKKDPRAAGISAMMKREYPNDPYTRKIVL